MSIISTPPYQRNHYIDFLKGIAAIFVIAIHCLRLGTSWQENTISFIIGIAVPLFIAINGYLSSASRSNYSAQSVNKHNIRIYIPTIIWAMPYLILSGVTFCNVLKVIICMIPVFYYFIPLLIQFNILKPITKGTKISFLCLAMLTSIAWRVIFYRVHNNLPFIIHSGLFPAFIGSYYLGAFIYEHKKYIPSWGKFAFLLLSIISLVIGIITTNEIVSHIAKLFFSYAIISFLLSITIGVRESIITNIGKQSLAFYLIHIYPLTFISAYLVDINHWMKTLLVFLSTSIIVILIKHLLPKLSFYMGINR